MAQRRMFSPDIVNSDAFLEMPPSTQALYFHLGMRADDDGFVNPKMVMRLIGSAEDDLKVLIGKRFVLRFDTGVVVIKHWLIHNLIRSDLYKETLYIEEKSKIGLKENGAYTEMKEGINSLKKIEAPEWLKKRRGELRTANVPQTALRLGKDRLGKDSIDTTVQGNGGFESFWNSYPRKIGKGNARKSWDRIKPTDDLTLKIIQSVQEHSKTDQWKKEGGQFIPHPSTFLNQERWDDEVKIIKTLEHLKA